jgi:type I site-specific restriction endonuclease
VCCKPDYVLIADGQAVSVIEAKREGSTLTGFEFQTQKCSSAVRRENKV